VEQNDVTAKQLKNGQIEIEITIPAILMKTMNLL